jgi:hypothetical protein
VGLEDERGRVVRVAAILVMDSIYTEVRERIIRM